MRNLFSLLSPGVSGDQSWSISHWQQYFRRIDARMGISLNILFCTLMKYNQCITSQRNNIFLEIKPLIFTIVSTPSLYTQLIKIVLHFKTVIELCFLYYLYFQLNYDWYLWKRFCSFTLQPVDTDWKTWQRISLGSGFHSPVTRSPPSPSTTESALLINLL